jgi:metal-responsive CopG/Arc/MetJ family transcriptional regulator
VLKRNKGRNPQNTENVETEIVNIRVPKDLILELDTLVKKRVFNSRSEAIREFAREYVQEQTDLHQEKENAKVSERGGRGW